MSDPDHPSPEPTVHEPGVHDAEIYRHLHTLLVSTSDVDEVLTELARLMARSAVGEVSCGITLRYDANLLTVGSSDDRAELLDETQYRLDGGPCLESLAQAVVVDCPDFEQETRWPLYRAVASEHGLRCSLSLPLIVAGECFGAINVYGFDRPAMFDGDQRHRLEVVAAQAAGALRIATRHAKDTALLAQLEEALTSRSVIDQALGIIMARQHCSSETAFELLRRQSRNTRRRLRDLARDLVDEVSGRGPEQNGGSVHR